MSIWRIVGPALMFLLVSGPLWAVERLSLIIANRDYRPYDDAPNAFVATSVGSDLQAAGLGLKPGKIDGKFDDETRKAIRRFQRAGQLPVTGYMTQATIVRHLAAK